MSGERFSELVSLYLDGEISEAQQAELWAVLAADARRNRDFRERCRLHEATRMILSPEASVGLKDLPDGGQLYNEAVQVARASLVKAGRFSAGGARREAGALMLFWRYTCVGLGAAAACVLLGLALAYPVIEQMERETIDGGWAAAEFEGGERVQAEAAGESVDSLEDPVLAALGASEVRRFANIRERRASHHRASLAAQLRLMGLRPELTPEEKQLRAVDLAESRTPERTRDDAARLRQVQQLSPIPEYRIFRAGQGRDDLPKQWGAGAFQSSLVAY
jgi:hypothetical protein